MAQKKETRNSSPVFNFSNKGDVKNIAYAESGNIHQGDTCNNETKESDEKEPDKKNKKNKGKKISRIL